MKLLPALLSTVTMALAATASPSVFANPDLAT